VLAHLAYDAWGQPMSGSNPTPYGYKGQWGYYTDGETGILLLTHRYFDPATGRFLTRDPIGVEGGVNLYAYVGNGVVMGSDPAGCRRVAKPFPLVLSGLVKEIKACLVGALVRWGIECAYHARFDPPKWKQVCTGCCEALTILDLYRRRYGAAAVKAMCAFVCGRIAEIGKHPPQYGPMPPHPSLPPPSVSPNPHDPNRPKPGECIRLPDGRVVCG